MKKFVWIVIILFLLVACSSDKGDIVRISVTDLECKDNGCETILVDSKTMKYMEAIFKEIAWEQSDVTMDREPNYIVNLFYSTDEDMPELVDEYRIWFNQGGTAAVTRHGLSSGYGGLISEEAKKLKAILHDING